MQFGDVRSSFPEKTVKFHKFMAFASRVCFKNEQAEMEKGVSCSHGTPKVFSLIPEYQIVSEHATHVNSVLWRFIARVSNQSILHCCGY